MRIRYSMNKYKKRLKEETKKGRKLLEIKLCFVENQLVLNDGDTYGNIYS